MIHAEHLTKRFGDLTAVDAVDFSVESGRVAGFLGPNGAGKTTTMRMLCGTLAPTSGRAVLGGVDVSADPEAAHRMLGWLPEGAPACDELRVVEYLRFRAGLFGGLSRSRIPTVLGQCGLESVSRRLVGQLSRGFRQRVALAAALLHDPSVLILDEPGTGLDPVQQRAFQSLLRTLAADRAILLSTHQLDEAEAVCDELLVIGGGRLLASADLEQLRSQVGGVVRAEVRGVDVPQTLERLETLADISTEPLDDGWVQVRCRADATAREDLFDAVTAAGGRLRSLHVESGSVNRWVRDVLAGGAE